MQLLNKSVLRDAHWVQGGRLYLNENVALGEVRDGRIVGQFEALFRFAPAGDAPCFLSLGDLRRHLRRLRLLSGHSCTAGVDGEVG